MEDSSGNSERRRRLLDALQKTLDKAVLDLRTYEKALALFEDDPSTSAVLQWHLLETVAAPIADKFLYLLDMDNKLKKGVEISGNLDETVCSGNLHSAADRASLAKALPQPLSTKALSTKAQSLVGALEGKRVDVFMDALIDLAEESGLLVKNPDETLELSKLHAFHKDLTAQVSSETDSIALLPKVLALLFLKVYKKAILVPGSAISAIISRLKGKLPEQAFKLITDYHKATVALSALRAAATGADDEDCLADRILTKEEYLEEMMLKLKALALGNPESGSSSNQ